MTVVVVEQRADEPLIELDLVKAHLRVDHGDDDDLILLYQSAIEGWLDGPAGWLGRALGPQTLRADLCVSGAFDAVTLPCAPIVAVSSLLAIERDGTERPLDPAAWVLTANRVRPAAGERWPANRLIAEYEAGYVEAALPRAIAAAMLLLIGDLYANRETAVVGTVAMDLKMTASAEALLFPYRTWHV